MGSIHRFDIVDGEEPVDKIVDPGDILVWWRLTEPDLTRDDYDAGEYFDKFKKFVREFSPPERTLKTMLSGAPVEILIALAGSASVDATVLYLLASEEPYGRMWYVWENLAKNTNAPAGALEKVAVSTRLKVRRALAGNIETPPTVLCRLAEDTRDEIRFALLGNPATPLQALRTLADQGTSEVRYEALKKVSGG